MKFLNITAGLSLAALGVYVLSLAKGLLVPLLIAIILSYIIISLANLFKRLLSEKTNKQVPSIFFIAAGIATCIIVIYAFYGIINSNVNNVIKAAPEYQQKLSHIVNEVTEKYPSLKTTFTLEQLTKKIDIPSIISEIANALTGLAGNTGMILVYVLFILLELRRLPNKFESIFPNKKRRKDLDSLIKEIDRDIKTYLGVKTIMSFSTALLSYIILVIVGVHFASFWATIIFILNYIPTIGSIIAVIFPIVLTLIQFDSMVPFTVVTVSLIAIQFTIGNIIEPRYLGKSLNLSPLFILISLMIMGSIWGIIGMFLSVPILGVINIIMAKFPQTKAAAIILSSDGNIEESLQKD